MKGKLRKIFTFILLVVVMFISKNVNAETLNYVETGYYYNRNMTNGHMFSDIQKNYSINGITTYCIEPGVKAGTIQYREGSLGETDLTIDMQERIKLIAFYGYGYPGHDSEKFRYATQALIWSTIKVGEAPATFSTKLYGEGEVLDIQNEMNEINYLVSRHNILPNFNSTSFDIRLDDTLTLVDSNNVLSTFDIISTDASIEITNNTIKITPLKEGKIEIKFKKKDIYSNNYKVYIADNYQNMFASGNIEKLETSIYVNSIDLKGKIKITKYGEVPIKYEEKQIYELEELSDIEYCLYNDNYSLIKCINTNKDGILEFNDLNLGIYYIKENKTLDKYILDDKFYKVDLSYTYLDSEYIQELEFINLLKKSNLKIVKTNLNKNILLSDAIFQIYSLEDELLYEGTTVDGIINIENIPYGKYYLIEKEAPKGYLKDNNKIYFSITGDEDVVIELTNIEDIKEVPNTGIKSNIYLLLFGIVSLISGLSLIIFLENNNN